MTLRTKNGWKVREHPGIGTFVAPNGKTVYCADDDVATIFRYVAEQWDKRIEPLPKADYNKYPNERKGYIVIHCSRPYNSGVGIGSLSNHVSHTAMDVLGDRHHYERSCSMANGKSCWGDGKPHAYISGFSAAQRNTLREIQREIGKNSKGVYVLRLGIDFASGWRDAMHVEIAPGMTNADVRAAAQAIRAAESVGDVVEIAEYLLELEFPATLEGLIEYQKVRGLVPDGKVGPKTRSALEADMKKLDQIIDQLAELSTIDLTSSQMAALDTGQPTWSTKDLIGVALHRLGWMYQRTANTRDAIEEMRELMPGRIAQLLKAELGDLPGVDPGKLESLVYGAVGEVIQKVELTVPQENEEASNE